MEDSSGKVESPPARVVGERFPKLLRLRSKKDFDHVFALSYVAVDAVLVIHGAPSKLAWTRLGLSISKRVGNAPQRNRWKRLIREAFRRERANLPIGLDIVVRPRKGSQPEYQQIVESLRRLVPLLAKQLNQRNTTEVP